MEQRIHGYGLGLDHPKPAGAETLGYTLIVARVDSYEGKIYVNLDKFIRLEPSPFQVDAELLLRGLM